MPVHLEFEPTRNFVREVLSEEITVADFLASIDVKINDPRFVPGIKILCDARGAGINLGYDDIERIVGKIRNATAMTQTRMALLRSDDLGFGLPRMFQAISDSAGMNVSVFRREGDAMVWLENRT